MNENLLRLIYSHKKCGLSDEQIMSVLLGMGIIPEVAASHLKHYNEITKNGENWMQVPDMALHTGFQVPAVENINKTNEKHNMRNFNLIQLYENLVQAAKDLHELSSVKTNVSYSAISAYSIVESTLAQFPGEVNLMIGRKNAGLPVDESKLNPGIKYMIAESVYNMLHESFLTPAKTLCAYIASTMEEDKWGYVAAKMLQECSRKSSNKMYAALYEDVQNAMLSDDIKESLKKVANDSEFWCNESKQIITLMESESFVDKKELTNAVVKNNNYSMFTLFSPVLENENSATFNLYGKNYTISEGKILETTVNDRRYLDVVEGLKLMCYNPNDETLEYYGSNGKVLEYKVNEDKICIGDQDLTSLASIDLRDRLSISGLFNKDTARNINTLVKMFESRDMIAKLDNCVNLRNDVDAAIFLTLISVEEGVYVNICSHNLLNEMKFFKSATAAKDYIKENTDYDATIVLMEALKAEGDRNAAILEERANIQERIDFLKLKRGEVISKIESLPENMDSKPLTDALNLLECEIRDNEIALGQTYETDCGANCVPVRVCNLVGTLVPGDIVYVDAATFTSAPDYTTISVTDPKTGAAVVVNKTDLVFDINHAEVEEPKISDPVVASEPACEEPVIADGTTVVCKDGECKQANVIVKDDDTVLINDENEENI